MVLHTNVRARIALSMLMLVLAGCAFELNVAPLVIPTSPSGQFSSTAQIPAEVPDVSTAASSSTALGHVETQSRGILWYLSWAAGALGAIASGFLGYFFRRSQDASRLRIAGLLILGLLILVVFGLVEYLLVRAEIILALAGLTGNLAAVFLSLILMAVGLFLVNFELAFMVYVYRVVNAPAGEEVRLELNPLDRWGLPH